MTKDEFNKRADKARFSAGWSQDSTYDRFQRHDNNDAPFTEPKSADTFTDALVGVIALAVLLIVSLLLWGAY